MTRILLTVQMHDAPCAVSLSNNELPLRQCSEVGMLQTRLLFSS